MPVSAEEVLWGYRLLLDRDPEGDIHIKTANDLNDWRGIREYLMSSSEYKAKNPKIDEYEPLEVIASLSAYGLSGRLFVNLADCIGRQAAAGTYEAREIAFLRSKLAPGHTFVDVGGNIGLFSLVASQTVGPSGHVVSIEPLPYNAGLFRKSIAENSFASNISLHETLVGDAPRDDMFLAYQSLDAGAGNSGGSYIVTGDEPLPHFMQKVNIPLTTLDTILRSERRVDFIKIDVEGAEILAMRGAAETLKKHRPTIMSEVHTSQLEKVSKASYAEYFRMMSEFGYDVNLLEEGKLGRGISDLENGKIYNVVFSPRRK